MGLQNLHIGTTVRNPHHNRVQLDKRAACGVEFYKYPTSSTTLDSLEPVNIAWDTSCLATTQVDIYLYAPSLDSSKVHRWENVDYAAGSYEVDLYPRWWNSTGSEQLQLVIIEAGNPPFMSSLPAGPIFTATYSEPAGGVPESADTTKVGTTSEDASVHESSGLSGGKVAAAVIMPLLVVIGLAIAAYIRFQRMKRQEASKRYSVAVDSRMSTINPDWSSISPAGASAAIRQSMAGNRASGFSFGGPQRPSNSFYANEDGGQAGIGARTMYQQGNIPVSVPQPRPERYGNADPAARQSQISFAPEVRLRPSAERTVGSGERVSRISFAPDARPSVDRLSSFGRPSGDTRNSAYSRPSRAFHSSFVVPDLPVQPARQNSDDSVVAGAMSPTQRQGPLSLTPETINARLSTSDRGMSETSNDDVTPAINMMRMQEDDGQYASYAPQTGPHMPAVPPSAALGTDTLFAAPMSPAIANVPEPAHNMFAGFAPAPVAMSPDDLLRAYAERSKGGARGNGVMSPPTAPGTPIQYPMPAAVTPGSPIQPPARVMSPAGPGQYSPSRGAYGVAPDDHDSPYSGI